MPDMRLLVELYPFTNFGADYENEIYKNVIPCRKVDI